jgi:hypothetical protein
MKKPPTGEPYAGKPHVRFGGRGGETLPDPYRRLIRNPQMADSGLRPNPPYAYRKVVPWCQTRRV